MIRKLHLYSLFLLITTAAFGQNGKLSGKITDKATKETLPFAAVRVLSGGQFKGGAVADESGYYSISPLTPGVYDVEFSLIGYQKRIVKDISISFEKTTGYNVALSAQATEIDQVTIEAYRKPLIDKDNTSTGTVLDAKAIEKLPTRNVNAVISTTAGVFSNDDGGALNVRGGRATDNIVYVNGVRQFGNAYPPVETIAEISVIIGGIPAQYGDALGGIISVTTKSAADRYRAGVQLETSRPFDKYNYDLAGLNFSGPLWQKKTVDPETNREEKKTIIGFYGAAQFQGFREADPSPYGLLVPKDCTLTRLENEPLVLTGIDRSGNRATPLFASRANYYKGDAFEKQSYRANSGRRSITLNTTIDVQPSKNILISFGGNYEYGMSNNLGNAYFGNQLFNNKLNNQAFRHEYSAFVRFRQSFANIGGNTEGKGGLRNFYYQLQADYYRTWQYFRDERFKNDYHLYEYTGKYTDTTGTRAEVGDNFFFLYDPTSGLKTDSVSMAPYGGDPDRPRYYTQGSVIQQGYPGNFRYDPYSQASLLGNANNQIINQYRSLGQDLNNPLDLLSSGGFANGIARSGLVNPVGYSYVAPGVQNNNLGYQSREQYRVSLQAAGDLGRHTIKIGADFEQRVITSWGGGTSPWFAARSLLNTHIISSLNNGTTLSQFIPTINQNGDAATLIIPDLPVRRGEDGRLIGQTDYDRRLRTLLNIPDNQLINLDGLDPKYLALNNFTVNEILNNGQNAMAGWQGYDAYGKRVNKRVGYFDYFTDTINRPIDAFRPIYGAFYVEDKFEIDDLIIRAGLRFDYFDVNTPVLRDQYSFTRLTTAGETDLSKFRRWDPINDKVINEPYTRPGNVGDDWAVYVNRTADEFNPSTPGGGGNESDFAVLGFRNGNQYYNANGTEVTDYTEVSTNGAFFPLYNLNRLNSTDRRLQREYGFTQDAFQDFKPQLNIMPRLAFSFPISEDALFFAHYDVLTQRPTAVYGGEGQSSNGRNGPILNNTNGDLYLSPVDLLTFRRQSGENFTINPNLKPQKKIDYQAGFQLRLSQNSALKTSLFYSEIKDLIQVVNVLGGYPNPGYLTNGNQDFGVIKGMILQYDYRKIGGTGFGFNAIYTLQYAEGSASNFARALLNTSTPNLRNIAPQNWDQRHAIKLNFDYRIEEGHGPRIGSFYPLANVGLNMTFYAGSGLPYTKDGSQWGQRTVIQGSINGSSLPWTNRTGLRIDKSFFFKHGDNNRSSLNVYVYVQNLFDQRNIIDVDERTGSPTDDGYLSSPFGQQQLNSPTIQDAESRAVYYRYNLLNPNNITLPRWIRLGIAYSF